jgi:hypothetical protein
LAITKFKTPDGGEHDGLVMWFDLAGERTKFVMPYGWREWSLVHYSTGLRVARVWSAQEAEKLVRDAGMSGGATHRNIAEAVVARIIRTNGIKKVRKVIGSKPVINP